MEEAEDHPCRGSTSKCAVAQVWQTQPQPGMRKPRKESLEVRARKEPQRN